jgi:hypothetical protein
LVKKAQLLLLEQIINKAKALVKNTLKDIKLDELKAF